MNYLAASAVDPGLVDMGLADAALVALLGYGVVFFGIILLMVVVMIMGKIFIASEARKKAAVQDLKIPAPAPVPVAEVTAPVEVAAPGTAGQLKLYDTPPKTTAMIMAIVADKMGKPLNELRFISIKEVKK